MAFLEGILPKTVASRLAPALAGNARFAFIGAAAVALTLIGILLLWSSSSNYAVLYAGLSGEEGGRAIAELQKLAIPYRISEGGRVIMVPTEDVGRARLQLAARGVPKQGNDEWSLLDNESLGVSPFVEQVHYVRGVEAALSHTIGEVDGVLSAKVTLALPKQTDFLADAPKPSASVMVRLRPGLTLSSAQVRGIVGLVASSVPGLTPQNVTVVDQTGRVLNFPGKEGLQQVPEQLEIAHQIDGRYEALITDLLAPVFGRGNFRVSVDADVDFSQSKESSVKYGQSHILSQDQTIHNAGSGAEVAEGIPGALSNRPPGTPTAPVLVPPAPPQTTQAAPGTTGAAAQKPSAPPPPLDSHTTTNFDLDRTVQFLQDPSWKLRGINVAVLVNNPTGKPIPAERIKSVKTLVTSAVGVGKNRDITVVDLPFDEIRATPEAAAPATSLWRAPWMRLVEQNAILAIAGLLALFGGLFPMLRRVGRNTAALATAGVAPAAGGGAPDLRAMAAAGTGIRPAAGPAAPAVTLPNISQDVFRVDTDTVRLLVANDPARTAQVIKEWMSRDRGSSKQLG